MHIPFVIHQKNSVALGPRANYTDWATATCWRNLVATFADRGVSRGQRGGSRTVVNRSFLDRFVIHSFTNFMLYLWPVWNVYCLWGILLKAVSHLTDSFLWGEHLLKPSVAHDTNWLYVVSAIGWILLTMRKVPNLQK
jgi:hypothetical protein